MLQKKKLWKMAVLLSLSLGLTVTACAEKIITIVDKSSVTGTDVSTTANGFASSTRYPDGTSFDITVQALSGTASDLYAVARAQGFINYNTLTIGESTVTVTAIGGTINGSASSFEIDASANATGIYNSRILTTEKNTITVTGIGGKINGSASSSDIRASADVFGIFNGYGNVITTGDNIMTVTAIGGEVSEGGRNFYGDIGAYAHGIYNNYNGVVTTGDNRMTVTAVGGKASGSGSNAYVDANTTTYGIANLSGGTVITGENTITVTAIGGTLEGNERGSYTEATAVGLYSSGNLTAVGSQSIYTEAVAGTVNGNQDLTYAYALLAGSGGTITLDSQEKAVQLTGDIGVDASGSIVVSLDNSDSYWRPRFQDTYGGAENGSFGSGSFIMQDGGVLDLAWHSNLGGYNFKDSQLNLTGDTIRIGDGATFIVNADLANNVADTITASTTATGTQYVRVAYDPSYLTYESVEGRALVLDFDGANGLGLASTVETPISNVTFMPIMEGGYLISLKRNTEVGEGGKTASDSYQQQINILRTQWSNLVQRLGDVRNENPASHNGAWARTYGGKFKSDGAYGRKSTMKYGGVQAGYDRMRETGSGKYLAGFLVDYMDADSDFQRGSGNTESLAFGGYWTWLSPKGHYADVVVKATHLDTDYDFYYLSGEKASADLTNWGYTMSMEYGYRYDLRKNRYIEPQAQFIVGRLEGKNYRTSDGVSLHQDGVNLAMGRLGVLFGWTDENKSSAYVRGSVVHDFSGSGTLTSNYGRDRMRIDTAGNSGTSFEVNVGANVITGKNSHLYAELTKSFGGDVKTDWQANVGWRVKW